MDTDSVGAGKTFYRKHAVFLTGGDVFGLKCAFGVQRFLLENRFATSRKPSELPGVVGANIFDLEFGKALERVDYERLGYEACRRATNGPVREGNVGAGFGATVGKLLGIKHAMKGGVGSSVAEVAGGIFKVGALVVTNAVGNVFESGGTTIAGTRRGKRFVEMEQLDYVTGRAGKGGSGRATTIGVVVTDLELSHEETIKVAEMAHDGLARCIRPVHGATDGDTIFCASTGAVRVRRHSPDLITLVGHLASTQVQSSVIRSVRKAKTLAGVPAVGYDE